MTRLDFYPSAFQDSESSRKEEFFRLALPFAGHFRQHMPKADLFLVCKSSGVMLNLERPLHPPPPPFFFSLSSFSCRSGSGMSVSLHPGKYVDLLTYVLPVLTVLELKLKRIHILPLRRVWNR